MRAAAQRRLDGEPIQYVLGHWPFRSLGPRPRPAGPHPATRDRRTRRPSPLTNYATTAHRAAHRGPRMRLGRHRTLAAVRAAPDGRSRATSSRSTRRATRSTSRGRTPRSTICTASRRCTPRGSTRSTPRCAARRPDRRQPSLRRRRRSSRRSTPCSVTNPSRAGLAGHADAPTGSRDLDVIIGQSCPWLVANGLLICEHGNMHRAAVLQAAQRRHVRRRPGPRRHVRQSALLDREALMPQVAEGRGGDRRPGRRWDRRGPDGHGLRTGGRGESAVGRRQAVHTEAPPDVRAHPGDGRLDRADPVPRCRLARRGPDDSPKPSGPGRSRSSSRCRTTSP